MSERQYIFAERLHTLMGNFDKGGIHWNIHIMRLCGSEKILSALIFLQRICGLVINSQLKLGNVRVTPKRWKGAAIARACKYKDRKYNNRQGVSVDRYLLIVEKPPSGFFTNPLYHKKLWRCSFMYIFHKSYIVGMELETIRCPYLNFDIDTDDTNVKEGVSILFYKYIRIISENGRRNFHISLLHTLLHRYTLRFIHRHKIYAKD